MRSLWWKFLGIGLLMYVFVVGLTTPLKPGIPNVSPDYIEVGERLSLQIEGYNTTFSDGVSAYLKLDANHVLAANQVQVDSRNRATAIFDIPLGLPSGDEAQSAVLVVTQPDQTTMILPDAVSLRNEGKLRSTAGWNNDRIEGLSFGKGFAFPYRSILHETIRNTFYHVSLWFAMFIMLIISLVYSVKYLLNPKIEYDIKASSITKTAILFGVLGVATGSIWARFTWGTFWSADVKLNMSTVALLIYLAYLVLRSSVQDRDRRAKLSSGYSIFAFCALIPLVFVIPRMTDSLHPGNGGNPALGGEDMDNTLRMVFYPAIIGFTMLGMWMASLMVRMQLLKEKLYK